MKRLFFLTLLAIFLLAGSGYAAVTHTDGDKYGDQYTVEDKSGNWTHAGNVTIQGTTTLSSTVVAKTPFTLLAATPDTVSTVASYNGNNSIVTAAKSGSMFVLTAPGGPWGSTATISLPGTYNTTITGLTYTFTTATGTSLAVRTGSATDSVLCVGTGGTPVKITSPASSGSTIVVVGDGSTTPGRWFVRTLSVGDRSDTSNKWTVSSTY